MTTTLALRESEVQARLDQLGATLHRKALAQASARHEIELRWLDDLRQYHGRYSEEVETRLQQDTTGSSRIFVNLTRPKCEALESRLTEMLFPTDDRNWLIQPTPNPDLAVLRSQSPGAADQAQALQTQAKLAADAMQREMDDQLTETDYPEKAKQAIHHAVLYGIGILKGPVIAGKVDKVWQTRDGSRVLVANRRLAPRVEVISPWDFFPDMSARTLTEAEFVFERRYVTRKTLRRLAQHPGYRPASIRDVLRNAPHGSIRNDWHRAQLREMTGIGDSLEDTQYEWWQYHGPIEREDALALGLTVPDDPLLGLECVIEMVDERVIRAELHPLDTQEFLYSLFALNLDESTPFGYGIPHVLRSAQTAINAAWRMMLDNAVLSVGPQIIVNPSVIKPADGVYALSARKVWLMADMGRGVGDAFTAIHVNNHQPEHMAIFETARALIEKESNIPDLMQGDLGSIPRQTASGMSMAMNAANTVLRRLIKRWDDEITKTLIKRFYDYNMQYSDLDDIKGDFEVDARGSSALMVKETQAQSLLNLIQIAQSPTLAPLTKFPALYRKAIETLRLSPDELVYTDDEIAAREAQQAQASSAQQAALPAAPELSPELLKIQTQQQMEAQRQQIQLQIHQADLAGKERMKAADLAEKERQRQYDWEKEQLKIQQAEIEARFSGQMAGGA